MSIYVWCVYSPGPGHNCIDDLLLHQVPHRPEEKQMVIRYLNHAGEKRVQGGRDLKSSQHYPSGFFGFVQSGLS